MDRILVVEDTDSLREVLCAVLRGEGYDVLGLPSAETALEVVSQENFSLVLSDLKLPSKSGLDLLVEARARGVRTPVVMMTAYGNIDIAVRAIKQGASDFITKPFDPGALCEMLRTVIESRRSISSTNSKRRPRQFLTQSAKVEKVLDLARRVAPLSSTVMIRGESGTGKELIARYIHEQSPRTQGQFVAINCASMPGELLESEFFGHEAGAFTGAMEPRAGLFEVAHNGTIFLDEIGNMPANLQMKLLRTLQESEIKRLGSTRIQRVDVRVISATNSNLEAQISCGEFREDLFYRLGVVVIEIPPLRERPEDIPLLANYYLKCLCTEFQLPFEPLPKDVMSLLQSYPWPGNVRELENVLERGLIFSGGHLSASSFELPVKHGSEALQTQTLTELSAGAARIAEIDAITKALSKSQGNKSRAARQLGISYKTLLNKVKEYQLGTTRDSKHGVH